MDKCSVVFVSGPGGWTPVDLVDSVVENVPELLKNICNRLIKASKIAEDFDLYCMFLLDLDNCMLKLDRLLTSANSEEDVEIPASVASAVLVGMALFMRREYLPQLVGEFKELDLPEPSEYRFVVYRNSKDNESMSDVSLCVYAYTKDCRFVGSYSLVDDCFLDKDGNKIDIEGKNGEVIRSCFDISKMCKGPDTQ